MKVLQVVETAYRATLEEQDDTVVWVTHAMAGAGGNFDMLLRGNAVNYAVKGQDASGLEFGAWEQQSPPQIAEDVGRLLDKGIAVHYVAEDAKDRGLKAGDMVDGLTAVGRKDVAALVAKYDQVWHW